MKKLLASYFILTAYAIVFAPVTVFAQATEYKLLAPLPFVTEQGSDATTTALSYIPGAIKLLIALAGAFAVIKIVIAGVQYMVAESFGGKNSAKKSISEALIGFLLVIGSFIILNTINPKFTDFDLTLPAATTTDHGGTSLTSDDIGVNTKGKTYGTIVASDKIVRDQLKSLGFSINRPDSCNYVGQPTCTTLTGLGSKVISGLTELSKACQDVTTPGNIVGRISGGTEYWLHGNRTTELADAGTAHQPGGNVIDLSLDPVVKCLRQHGTPPPPGSPSCTSGTERYKLGSGIYVNEQIEGNDPHWHACFY